MPAVFHWGLHMQIRFRSGRIIRLFCICILIAVSPVAAQQFQEQQSTRFPQPAALDYSNQLTIGDIDGDGDLDIIWANGGNFSSAGTNQISRIYINNGSGVFTDESVARGAFTGLCRGVELGDIDNDGDLDMVLAQDFNRQPQLLLNNGSGVFTNVTAVRLPVMTLSCTRAQFGDIDNDGDLDLYLTNGGTTSRFGSGQNRVFVNNGAGFFTDATATLHPVAVLAEPQDAIFGDIDGDLDIDVRVGSTASNQSRLYRNNGLGVFAAVAGVPADNNCYSYDFGDIDNDGDLDLFGANASGTTANADLLLRNDGTGAYSDVSANYTPNPGVDDNDSKFFDYDNDGDLDLIVARLGSVANSPERIYNNNGSGVFTEVTGLITSISDSTLDIMVADLNGDGRLDIVTAQGESGNFTNRIYMNITGPVDTRSPRIVSMEQQPDTTNRAGPYVIRAAILDGMTSDRNFFDRGISLKYSIDGGPVQMVPMRHSGGQIYRGVIPGAPCGGVVTYFVEARDFANNLGVGTSKMFTVMPPAQGDLNDDGIVDTLDAQILAAVLVGADTDPLHLCQADINADGMTDGLDVQALVLSLP